MKIKSAWTRQVKNGKQPKIGPQSHRKGSEPKNIKVVA